MFILIFFFHTSSNIYIYPNNIWVPWQRSWDNSGRIFDHSSYRKWQMTRLLKTVHKCVQVQFQKINANMHNPFCDELCCLVSLSYWNTKLCLIFSCLAVDRRWCWWIWWWSFLVTQPASCHAQVPTEGKQMISMILPPPCLTLATLLLGVGSLALIPLNIQCHHHDQTARFSTFLQKAIHCNYVGSCWFQSYLIVLNLEQVLLSWQTRSKSMMM